MANNTRKPAPQVAVVGIEDVIRDERKDIINDLDKKSPEFIHSYQSGHITQEELSRKGQEIVKNDDGTPIKHEGDLVVRVSRERFLAKRARESAESLRSASRVVKDPKKIMFKSSPVEVKPKQEE